ncbi:MAG: Flp pilus assembly pilin Flp [Cellvibrionaceae bacterium]|jgi:Flp pilus assembly pilin Flp
MKGKLKQLGQGMTEYIIIVALIAVAAITVYGLFGDVIQGQVGAMSQELSGVDGSGEVAASQTSAGNAAAQNDTETNLGNYTEK